MKLYVMRHGPAEDHAATGRDQDRALTPSGRDRVRTVANLLAREGELPARIVSSSLVRAAQTADIVAATAGVAIETRPELAPGGPVARLVEKLRADNADRTMLIGHEPDLSSLIDELLGAPLEVSMDKAMVVALELEGGATPVLRFVVEPRAGEILHDARTP